MSKRTQLSKEDHKQLKESIENHIAALEEEVDPQLKDATKRRFERFLSNFHSSNSTMKNAFYKIMNGRVYAIAANEQLTELWDQYQVASEALRERRSSRPNPPSTAPLNMYPVPNPDPYLMHMAQASQSGSLSDPIVGARHYGPYTSFGRDNRTSVASASSSDNYGYRQLAQPHGSGASTSQTQGTQQYPNTNPQYAVQSGQQFYASYPPTQPVNGGAGQTHSYNPQWNYTQPPNGYPF